MELDYSEGNSMEKSRSFHHYRKSEMNFDGEMRRSSTNNSYNFNGGRSSNKGTSSSAGYSTSNDRDSKRKKRVASYNMFTLERKLKSSVKNSFRWIKSKFSDVNNAPPCEN